jgi:hypothetical protein
MRKSPENKMQFPSASDPWIASLHWPALYPSGKIAILQPTNFFHSPTK